MWFSFIGHCLVYKTKKKNKKRKKNQRNEREKLLTVKNRCLKNLKIPKIG